MDDIENSNITADVLYSAYTKSLESMLPDIKQFTTVGQLPGLSTTWAASHQAGTICLPNGKLAKVAVTIHLEGHNTRIELNDFVVEQLETMAKLHQLREIIKETLRANVTLRVHEKYGYSLTVCESKTTFTGTLNEVLQYAIDELLSYRKLRPEGSYTRRGHTKKFEY